MLVNKLGSCSIILRQMLRGKILLWSDLFCVEWDVKLYSVTHSMMFSCM